MITPFGEKQSKSIRSRNRTNVLVVGFLIFVSTSLTASTSLLAALDGGKPTLAPMLERVTGAVVNISVIQRVRRPSPFSNDPFFERFFGIPNQQQYIERPSAGSGVVIDAEMGYVVSNHHVIENASEIKIKLLDGRLMDAELLGSDPTTDVALLKIDAINLEALSLSNSDELRIGDFVVAIGNPYGLGQTVTSGIVSALGRNVTNQDAYEDFIQTDASINPGNSGGALVDLDGKLVGINSAIYSPTGVSSGIGFAIPSNMVKAVTDQLIKFGDIRRGRLGVLIRDLVPEDLRQSGLQSSAGAVIDAIESGSAAELAGLEPGDVIVAVNDVGVEDSSDLRNKLGIIRVGQEVDLTIVRDGAKIHVAANIRDTNNVPVAENFQGQQISVLAGLSFSDISKDHPSHGIDGVIVSAIESDSYAYQSGLRVNDIVYQVNRRRVSSLNDLAKVNFDETPLVVGIIRGRYKYRLRLR